jgi:predicted PurR-regulated permease PerM
MSDGGPGTQSPDRRAPGPLIAQSQWRVVELRPRTAFLIWGALVAIAIALWLTWTARHMLTWIVVAAFLATAMSPAVDWLQRHGIRRRGAATGLVYVTVFAGLAALGALFLPKLIAQVNDFVNAVPGYVDDLTHGRGSLGFLETKYHVVERTRDALGSGTATDKLAGGAATLVSVTQSIVNGIVGLVTIGFLTFFMVLEGPDWTDRTLSLLPPESERRWRRLAGEVKRVIGGYVTGNLLISAIAATSSTIVLLVTGVPFPLALGLLVFILDLIPLAGATLAAVVLTLVALTQSVSAAVIVLVFFIVYQQIENHLLQPLVYGRTVQLSPLLALISVLLGAAIGGVLGALGAIPIAGSIQAIVVDWRQRRESSGESVAGEPG